MEITDKIKQKRDAIWKSVGRNGHSDGTATGTEEEMWWLAMEAARDGILLSYRDAPETYQKDNECYYYYDAMSIKCNKEKVRLFVDTYPLLSSKDLKRAMDEATDKGDKSAAENIKKVRNLVIARNRRRNKRQREEQQARELQEELQRELDDRKDAADHRNDLTWLIERIESLGWKVTLTRAE